jgi:hypothetical protein
LIILHADNSTIITPVPIKRQYGKGYKGYLYKIPEHKCQSMVTIKWYFHRLFPRAEGDQFYCNIILASDLCPTCLMDTIDVHLRDNKMGLWRHSIDAEQVSEIGWLTYSIRQQDEKRLASLLSNLTAEKIAAHCRVIRMSTTARKQQGTQAGKQIEVRVICLKCNSAVLQFTKHKVNHLYCLKATEFPDGK